MSKALQKQLKTFIDRVDAQEKLAEDSSKDNAYEEEYRVLRTLGQTNKEEKRFPTEEGRKDDNIKKNRYKDILPFDATRVPLTPRQDEPGSDYINANFITGANGKVAYIASQGPLPHTVPDFWRMLWQYKVEVIVMVCQLVENAKVKCEKYWSNNPSEVKQIGNFHIKTVDEEKVNPYFIVRTLSVWHTKKEAAARTLTQFHYTGWMDHDIPNDVSDIIQLINRMRAKQTSEAPAVIHCSAGCGRTGTICAIDYAWSVLKGGTMTEDFSLYDIILNMRSQRQSMVQTPDQYRVVHLAVRAMFEEHLQLIGDHNYENFDLNKDGKLKNRSIPHTKGAAPQPDTGSEPINHGNVISPTKPAVTDSKANPSKPSSLNIPVSGADKTKTSKAPGAEKKPAADSKPLLSPKPVTTPETLPAHNSSNATNSTALKAGAKRSPGYQNVELDDIIQLSKPNSGTSSKPQQQISQPQRPPKTTIHSKADVPNSADTRRTSADKKSVSKSNYENSNPPSKISDQPSSHALQEVKSADDDNRMSVPYAVVSKTSKTPTTPPSSISKRGPALLPPSAGKNSTTDYEVVSIPKGRQDYSYAEPNSTEKWEFQGLARSFDQKGHAPGRGTPGEAYEEVDVNKSHPKPLKVSGVSSPTYTGHVDQEKKKTGIIDTLKSKMSNTGKPEPEPTATKDKHLKELASVVMNKKEILGFNQRGKRPAGPRRMPVGWRYESSL